jgi:hypothetical protein
VLHENLKLIETVRPNLVYCGAYRQSVTLTSRDFAQVRHVGIGREPCSLPDPCRHHLPTNTTSQLRVSMYMICVNSEYLFRNAGPSWGLSDIKAKISLCSPIPSSMVSSSSFWLIWALTSITWATADFVSDLSSKGFQVLVPGSSDYTNASKACKPSALPTCSKTY